MILHIEETSCFVISFDLLDEKIALVLDVTNVMAKVERAYHNFIRRKSSVQDPAPRLTKFT